MEFVDILSPPDFRKSGETKPVTQAWEDGDWIGTFNLWIVRRHPEPAILYQRRSLKATWEPGKLDLSAGGHYRAGEDVRGGLREVHEELGREYAFKDLVSLGRRLNVTDDAKGRRRHYVVDVFLVEDDAPLSEFRLQKEELEGLFICPIESLIAAHEHGTSFVAHGLDAEGNETSIEVSRDSFPYNWDDYHHKMALMAERHFKGERKLLI